MYMFVKDMGVAIIKDIIILVTVTATIMATIATTEIMLTPKTVIEAEGLATALSNACITGNMPG
jgi:hypothetical protein